MIPLAIIHQHVVNFYQVPYFFPFKKTAVSDVVYVRQVFHYLARKLNGKSISFYTIGNYYSDISGNTWTHATVLNSVVKVEGYMQTEARLKQELEELTKRIELYRSN